MHKIWCNICLLFMFCSALKAQQVQYENRIYEIKDGRFFSDGIEVSDYLYAEQKEEIQQLTIVAQQKLREEKMKQKIVPPPPPKVVPNSKKKKVKKVKKSL